MWEAAERFLRRYGDLAEAECDARVSYYEMIWDWVSAARLRRSREFILRLRRGERPPLQLGDAVLTGRFAEFLAQQETQNVSVADLEAEITDVIRSAIKLRLQEQARA